jgi:hypothetical protein
MTAQILKSPTRYQPYQPYQPITYIVKNQLIKYIYRVGKVVYLVGTVGKCLKRLVGKVFTLPTRLVNANRPQALKTHKTALVGTVGTVCTEYVPGNIAKPQKTKVGARSGADQNIKNYIFLRTRPGCPAIDRSSFPPFYFTAQGLASLGNFSPDLPGPVPGSLDEYHRPPARLVPPRRGPVQRSLNKSTTPKPKKI